MSSYFYEAYIHLMSTVERSYFLGPIWHCLNSALRILNADMLTLPIEIVATSTTD